MTPENYLLLLLHIREDVLRLEKKIRSLDAVDASKIARILKCNVEQIYDLLYKMGINR